MHDELKEAIARIHRAAKENGKSSGIYSTSGDQARAFADQGFNMVIPLVQRQSLTLLIRADFQVSVATDVPALSACMTSSLTAARGSYVHSALNIGKGAVSGLAKMAKQSEQ